MSCCIIIKLGKNSANSSHVDILQFSQPKMFHLVEVEKLIMLLEMVENSKSGSFSQRGWL